MVWYCVITAIPAEETGVLVTGELLLRRSQRQICPEYVAPKTSVGEYLWKHAVSTGDGHVNKNSGRCRRFAMLHTSTCRNAQNVQAFSFFVLFLSCILRVVQVVVVGGRRIHTREREYQAVAVA
jgi:hypothetical protein